MAFRFDMQGKTPQQQIIVAKRDEEDKRRREEAAKKVKSKISADTNSDIFILVIDRDTCPVQDIIITKQQCSDCKYCKGFKIYNEQSCVECSHK